jgi:hypothetical protein
MVVQRKDAKEKPAKDAQLYFEIFAVSLCALCDGQQFRVYKMVVQRKDAKEKPAKDARLYFEIFAVSLRALCDGPQFRVYKKVVKSQSCTAIKFHCFSYPLITFSRFMGSIRRFLLDALAGEPPLRIASFGETYII